MTFLQITLAAVIAAVFHALALCIVARFTVRVPVRYAQALQIVVLEYGAVAAVAGAMLGTQLGNQTVAIVACSLAYLFVGAGFIGTWLVFDNGTRLGVGNGILIQALQIPLIIPVLIVGSFLFDLFLGVPSSS
ncbi:MAG: hypothetical protein ACREUU_04670 [Gammaproteobacteria bacterium]